MSLIKNFSKVVLAGALTLSASAWSATAVLINLDPPGLGLNDNTPAAPVGGNPGTTIGEQRTIVYQAALEKWGDTLVSNVPIFVGAAFSPLACSPADGVLGTAGPIYADMNFPGALKPDTWYVAALADALADEDRYPGDLDIISFFNSEIDDNDPNCLTGTSWYYGLDGDNGDDIDFLAVVTHEINHGLGHMNLVFDETVGELFLGFPDTYTDNSLDLTLGKTWSEMTNAERVFSAVNDGNLVWNGAAVTTQAPSVLGDRPSLFIDDPDELEGSYEALAASFGKPLRRGGPEREVVLADDGTGISTDACEPLVNGRALKNKVALIDRGGCAFTTKVKNAQDAGAKGAIVANNLPKGLAPMGGSDSTIKIQSVGITQALGDALKAALAADDDEVEVTLALDKRFTTGVQDGFVRLYAPDPVRSGSSISHWDLTASPNLLMEPFAADDLEAFNLDLSPALLQDIGWNLTDPLPTSGGGSGGGSGGDDDDDDDD